MANVGKEWSPKTFSSSQIAEEMIDFLEHGIENQRVLTKYKGSDEGFRGYVANIAWDPYTYKLIGENTGYIFCILDLMQHLDIQLPESLLKRAALHVYTD